MNISTKQRLAVLLSILSYVSVVGSFILFISPQQYLWPFLFTLGVLGFVLSAGLEIHVAYQKPRHETTRQISFELPRPPSFESVSLYEPNEIWRWFLTIAAMVTWLQIIAVWSIAPEHMSIWLYAIQALALIVYLHECLYGPHGRRFWIAYILGEYFRQPWVTGRTAEIERKIYPKEYTQEERRLVAFLGKIPVYDVDNPWYEIRVVDKTRNIDTVSYVQISLQEQKKLGSKWRIPMKYRHSRLDPKRLQVSLA